MTAHVDRVTFLSEYLPCPEPPFPSPPTSPPSSPPSPGLPLPAGLQTPSAQSSSLPSGPQTPLPQSPPQSSAPLSPRSEAAFTQSASQSPDVDRTPLPRRILRRLKENRIYQVNGWVDLPQKNSPKVLEKTMYSVVMRILKQISHYTREYCSYNSNNVSGEWFDTHNTALLSWSRNTVAQLRPDFIFAHEKTSKAEPFWSQTFSVIELNSSPVVGSKIDSQLNNYVSHIFAEQVDRLFVTAVTWRAWELQVYRFDRSGIVRLKERIDIHKDPEAFIQVIASFSYLSPADLGWDPTCNIWDSVKKVPQTSYTLLPGRFRGCGVYDIPWVLRMDDESFVVIKAVNPKRWLSMWGRASFVVHVVTLADWENKNGKAPVYILKQCWQRLPGLGPDPKTAELQNTGSAMDATTRNKLIDEFDNIDSKPFEETVMARGKWEKRLTKSWVVKLDGKPITTFDSIRKNHATYIECLPHEQQRKGRSSASTSRTCSATGTPADTGASAALGIELTPREEKRKRAARASTTRTRSASGTPAETGTPTDTGTPGTPPLLQVPGLGVIATSRTSATSGSSARSRIPGTMKNVPSHQALVTRTLVRLVFNRPGWPIRRFKSKRELLEAVKMIVEDLRSLYEAGVIHRDVSPSNLIISDSSKPGGHIIDFDHSKIAYEKSAVRQPMETSDIGKIASSLLESEPAAAIYLTRLKLLWQIEGQTPTRDDFQWSKEIKPVFLFRKRDQGEGFFTGTYKYLSPHLKRAPFHNSCHDLDSLFWSLNEFPLTLAGPGGEERQDRPNAVIELYYGRGPHEKREMASDFAETQEEFQKMATHYSDYFKDLTPFMMKFYGFVQIACRYEGSHEYYHPHDILLKIIQEAIDDTGHGIKEVWTDAANEEIQRREKEKG